jgi:putative cardiolipin synthase
LHRRLGTELPPSAGFARPTETALGREAAQLAEGRGGHSGVRVLQSGLDAFAARMGLVDRSERAVDLQVYILHDDVTGRWLLARLLAAADRGVRVRLLVDDLGTSGLDQLLSALNGHHAIEVRLFNPFHRGRLGRFARIADGFLRFGRLSRRMHNKLLVVDGAAAVAGGRNVGDAYFDAHERVNFADMDLLAIGPVVEQLSESFDTYWNSRFAVPIHAWPALRTGAAQLGRVREELVAHETAQQSSPYAELLRNGDLARFAIEDRIRFDWAPVRAAADRPEKITAPRSQRAGTLLNALFEELLPRARSELLVTSAYFVPQRVGTRALSGLAAAGVRVRVLTNSLAATDVALVHAGYARWRRRLLRAGVELCELRPRALLHMAAERRGLLGSSSASLHAKTWILDRERIFVGSLNIDPRSVALNTELGLVVESPELSRRFAERFEAACGLEASWRIELGPPGSAGPRRLAWVGTEDGRTVRHAREPETSWLLRAFVWLAGFLPIEGQL